MYSCDYWREEFRILIGVSSLDHVYFILTTDQEGEIDSTSNAVNYNLGLI